MAWKSHENRMELSPPSVLFDGTLAHFQKARYFHRLRNSTMRDWSWRFKGPVVATTWSKGPRSKASMTLPSILFAPHHVTDVFASAVCTSSGKAPAVHTLLADAIELRRKVRHATFRPRRHVWSCEDGTGPCCKLVGFAHHPLPYPSTRALTLFA